MKPIIYQLLPRLFSNANANLVENGSIQENGVGKFEGINDAALSSIKRLGTTHVWFTGIIRHATQTDYSTFGLDAYDSKVVKGKAGSPYAITDYYDVDPDLAVNVPNRMDEFCALVRRTHSHDLKALIDFVPNHVGRQYHSVVKPDGIRDLGEDDRTDYFFEKDNNFYYLQGQSLTLPCGNDGYRESPAKVTGNDCFSSTPSVNDWYETIKLNYGVDYSNRTSHFDPIPSTWHKMLDILLFWCQKGIDGFRCDMAHMVPVEFWHWAIGEVKVKYPNVIFIAELYDVGLYRSYIEYGGFDYLYDKVNLYDTLCGVAKGQQSASNLTGCWQRIDGINSQMLNFLENHDEMRLASSMFLKNPQLALPALVASLTMSKAPFMLYFGQELGEKGDCAEGFSGHDGKTTIFDYWSLDTVRRWYDNGKCDGRLLSKSEIALRNYYEWILNLTNNTKALCDGDFFDLMYVNNKNLNFCSNYAYLRHSNKETVLIILNFGDHVADLNVCIPQHAFSMFGLPAGEQKAVDLQTGENFSIMLQPDECVKVTVAPHNATLIKIC